MDTLMRISELFVVGIVLLTGLAAKAEAQTPARRSYYLNINGGTQAQDQTFTESATFDLYGERGAIAAGHSLGGGSLIDISAGAQVWRSFTVGIGYSAFKNTNDAIVSIRVPHPVLFNRPREASATAPDLEHTENVVHLQFGWTLPVTDKIQFAFMVGPSFFTVRQDMATVRPSDIRDVTPFTSVTINSVTVTDVKASPVGVNIGIDGAYFITRMIGAGVFARYAGASVEFPDAAGSTVEGDLKVGGFQAGGGLRLRF